ncbi:MAG: hypothetical protein ABIK28_06165 [Planctomycetota bacterium]
MEFWRFMATWGIWDIIGLIAALIPIIMVIRYIFPRKAVTNLYIDTKRDSINQGYPKVVRITFRNHTNEPLYVLSEGFTFGSAIRRSPNAARNAATSVCEVKFEGRQHGLLSEIDTLVRPGQEVSTWVPVDPQHSDQEVDSAIENHSVGTLRLKCQKVTGRREAPIRMKIPV